MGMIRKMWSVTTVGIVPYRSKEEKEERHKKAVRKELKEQTKLLKQRQR